MIVKQIVEELFIKQREQATVTEIFATGSQVLAERETDKDFVVICKGYAQRYFVYKKEVNGVNYDIFIFDEEAAKALLDFNDLFYVTRAQKPYNYFWDKAIKKVVYGKWDYEWNMLEHKNEYLAYLKTHYENGFSKVKPEHLHYLGNQFVHYYVVLSIYENNKVEITEKMKDDIALLYSKDRANISLIENIISKIKGDLPMEEQQNELQSDAETEE
jgi:hypothetical protein